MPTIAGPNSDGGALLRELVDVSDMHAAPSNNNNTAAAGSVDDNSSNNNDMLYLMSSMLTCSKRLSDISRQCIRMQGIKRR